MKTKIQIFLAVVFWLAVWQVAAILIDRSIILCTPIDVLKTLYEFTLKPDFWTAVLTSFTRIVGGFLVAVAFAVLTAPLSARFSAVRTLLAPVISVIKVTPVASLVIFVLFVAGVSLLSGLVTFLIVYPVVYTNLLTGIMSARKSERQLFEAAAVYKWKFSRTLRYVYLPALLPQFIGAVRVTLGLCWKAGTAAEVIGGSGHSLGEMLYYSKVYFDTRALLAVTTSIIIVSVLFEKIFIYVLDVLAKKLVYK